jgi:hypothetical protein
VVVWSSIRISSTSMPSRAKKPCSRAMNSGPKPTQTVCATRSGSAWLGLAEAAVSQMGGER